MEYLENREISWLKFNKRVLEEASAPETPLLERLSFSAIYQSNLDEFFMVRVGALTDDEKDGKNKKDSFSGMTVSQQLDAVFTKVRRYQPLVEEAYRRNMSDLKAHGFEQVTFETASEEEQRFLELYFKREVKPFISGIVVNDALPFPFLRNKELYAVVRLGTKKKVSIGIIPVQDGHTERMIPLSNDGKRFILIEDVVLHFAHLMFKGCKVIDRAVIRVTRNADIMVSGRGAEFRDRMEELVVKRTKLAPVRLEVSDDFSHDALDYLCKKLKLKPSRVFTSHIPLELSFLYTLQELSDDPELHYAPLSSRMPASLSPSKPIFPQIRARDMILSYPFESMNLSFIKLLQEAAYDPKVTSIKITLYRLAKASKVIDALCAAAEHGKEVLVMIELRARFDEANNIEWSKHLQKAGITVVYGPKDCKAHSKLLLITRKAQGGGFEYITQVGTGNYNEKTSKLYTDIMLLTSDKAIAADAEKVFSTLRSGTFVEQTEKLLVAPLCLRNKVLDLMDSEIEKARRGEKGYIAAKVNSLNDNVIIDKLVEASQAGVKIELIVRGICCIIAGVPGYTENITVRSIVGRFLEHSRIFIFGNDGDDQKIYIGSADYMVRNTVKRVEVAAPVEDPKLKKRIREMFRVMMRDNVKAREMLGTGSYVHVKPAENEELINSQEYLYAEAYKRLEDKEKRTQQLSENRERAAAKKAEKAAKAAESSSRRKTPEKTEPAADAPAKKRGRPKKEETVPVKKPGRPKKEETALAKKPGRPKKEETAPAKKPGRPKKEETAPVKKPGRPKKEETAPVKKPGRPKKTAASPKPAAENPPKRRGRPRKTETK